VRAGIHIGSWWENWKRSLGRPRHRRVDNIKMDVREIEWSVWMGLIWLRIETSAGLL
jgi:hypothetical protein